MEPPAAQVRIVPSAPAVASHEPSGAIATARTQLSWPYKIARGVPPVAQIRAVPSAPVVASHEPSGAIATASTGPRCPAMVRI